MGMLWFRLYSGRVYPGSGFIQVKLSRVIIGSVSNRVWFSSGSVYSFSIHFGSAHCRSGLNCVGSFRVQVISVHTTIRVSFGYGSVHFGCSDPNQLILFRVSVRVQIQIARFEYGSRSFSSGFRSRVSFARHVQVNYNKTQLVC